MATEQIPVTVKQGDGAAGFGWYVWESDYPEDGYVWFGVSRPSADDLHSVCQDYVEETK